MAYNDGMIMLARTREQSIKHMQIAVDCLHSLGYDIHPDKLQDTPRQSVEFLGFQVNLIKMQFRVLEKSAEPSPSDPSDDYCQKEVR